MRGSLRRNGRYERTYLNDSSGIPRRSSIPVLREYIFKIARSDLVTRDGMDNTFSKPKYEESEAKARLEPDDV